MYQYLQYFRRVQRPFIKRLVMEYNTVLKVFYFVSEECKTAVQKLSLQTTLLGELGMDGDDAIEFFENFSETFKVDMSEFDINKHFCSEGYPPHILLLLPLHIFASILHRWLFGKDPHETAGVIPITIADLVKAAENGK